MTWLRANTAVEVNAGRFVDSADGNTEKTALTINQADVRLKKNADNWAQKHEATAAVHEEKGNYRVLLDTTDTNQLGILEMGIHVAGALEVSRTFMVVPEDIFDLYISGSQQFDTAADVADVIGTRVVPPSVAAANAAPTQDQILTWLVQRFRNATRVSNIITVKDHTGSTLYTIDVGDPVDPPQSIQQ